MPDASLDGLRAAACALFLDQTETLPDFSPAPALFASLFGPHGAWMAREHQQIAPEQARLALALRRLSAQVREQGVEPSLELELLSSAEIAANPALFARTLKLLPALQREAQFGFVFFHGMSLPFWILDGDQWCWLGYLPALAPQRPTAQGLLDRLKIVRHVAANALAGDPSLAPELSRVLENLVLPQAEDWFSSIFGPERAPSLCAEYAQRLSKDEPVELCNTLSRTLSALEDEARAQGTSVALHAEGHLSPWSQEVTLLQARALGAMRRPVPLFTVTLGGNESLWSFVFVEGSWRWLGKLYALDEAADPEDLPGPETAPTAYPNTPEGLARALTDATREALAGHRESFVARCASFVLPDPTAAFGSWMGEPGRALGASQPQALAIAELFLAYAQQERLLVTARVVRDTAEVPTVQRLWTEQAPSAPPLYQAAHHGPEGHPQLTSWVFMDGAWRFLALAPLRHAPGWREALRYPWPEDPARARFANTEAGLTALCETLATAAHTDRTLFLYLLDTLLPEAPEDWFLAGYPDESARRTARAAFLQGRAEQRQLLSQRFALLPDGHAGHHFTVGALQAQGWYIVLWRAPGEDAPLRALLPLGIYEGAWRLLDGLRWTESLLF